jgi:hypothetical protein
VTVVQQITDHHEEKQSRFILVTLSFNADSFPLDFIATQSSTDIRLASVTEETLHTSEEVSL